MQSRQLHWWPIIAPPLILSGLFVGLWCWKCTMLVLCQNMIIYNPFLPPNARSMRIEDFERQCVGVRWREERIKSLDGTEIALCINHSSEPQFTKGTSNRQPVYILYFQGMLTLAQLVICVSAANRIFNQGNASSLPPRLPDLSRVMKRLAEDDDSKGYSFYMVGLSYRGYWTSHDRPSEAGINKDAEAALRWICQQHKKHDSHMCSPSQPLIILYGQSIGCGFATNLAATTQAALVSGLVLETPFTSTRDMLKALYPQKWLPYRYLWPFLRSHLDTWQNLGTIAQRGSDAPSVHIIEAGKDELVPAAHGEQLYQRCLDLGLSVERTKIPGALHNDAIVRVQGKVAVKRSIASAVRTVCQVEC
jgi:fermentation-respiration switch protein FrsA (DUF1100 family)